MSEQANDQTPITAAFLAEQLAQLSQLKATFEAAEHEYLGGDDAVSNQEFFAWQKRFAELDESDADQSACDRHCMNAYEELMLKMNSIRFLPQT